jgi:DNA-binding response OmpR family regulator
MALCVLVVEDDPAIRRGVVDSLRFAGYSTLEAADGRSAREATLSAIYDLLLLDLVLPGGDGLDILRELRKLHPAAPVIIMTARGSESDRVTGLKLGADDYIVKPFSVRELLARIEAVLRRSPERPAVRQSIRYHGGVIDLDKGEVLLSGGSNVLLTSQELEFIRYIAAYPRKTISRDEILSRVWRVDPRGMETRTIDMHIARLREKLNETDPPTFIVTVRGKGYRLEPSE